MNNKTPQAVESVNIISGRKPSFTQKPPVCSFYSILFFVLGLVSLFYFIWVGQGQAEEFFINIAPTTFIGVLLLLSGWIVGAFFGFASIVRGEKYLWLSLFSFAINSLPLMGVAYLFSG